MDEKEMNNEPLETSGQEDISKEAAPENIAEPVNAAAPETADAAAPAEAEEVNAAAPETADAAAPAEAETSAVVEAPVDPEATLSLDELPQEETGVLTEDDIFNGNPTTGSSENPGAGEDNAAGFEEVSKEAPAEGTGESFTGNTSTYSYGNDNPYSDAARSYQYAAPGASYAAPAHAKPGYITKRAFILILIIAMLLTMLASVGITTAYTTYLNNKTNANGHATNYTLKTSNESLSYSSIIEKTQDSVVSITTESVTTDMWLQNYVTQGAGSGVIIQNDGYIITCEHVVSGARKITVTLRDGKEYDAELIGADANNDIAVIKIEAKGLQEATYGDSSKLVVGDQVVAIGNPLGTLSGTATTGIISALNRNLTIDNRTLNLFQTDASINPGNSGGGMFDASGNLIGIVEAKSTGSDIDGLGFATPINKAAKIAKEIIEKGGDINSKSKSGKITDQKVIIGIMVTQVDEQTARQYGYSHGGLLIRQVTSDEAKKAGLQSGDIIFQADGTSISTNDELTAVLSKKKEGDTVKLSIARENGMTTEITTRLISNSTKQ